MTMSSAHIGQGVRAVGAAGRLNSASRGWVGCMPPPAPSSSARQYADRCSESRRTRSCLLVEASSASCRTARTATAFASRKAWLAARHPSRSARRSLPLSSAWRACSIVLDALTSLRPLGDDGPASPHRHHARELLPGRSTGRPHGSLRPLDRNSSTQRGLCEELRPLVGEGCDRASRPRQSGMLRVSASRAARPASRRATGTRKGEHET
jgi:hypothetical protein